MPPLIEALKDNDTKVRASAADALGAFPKDDNALAALKAAMSDPDAEVRRSTILSLGRLAHGDSMVEDMIREKLQDQDRLSASNAIIALALMGKYDDGGLPVISDSLANSNETVAKAAARALGSIGVEKPDLVLPLLIKALEDKNSTAARNALPALRKMKKDALPALPKVAAMFAGADAATRSDVLDTVSALDEKGDFSLPIFVKSLESDDPIDRREALLGLLRLKSAWKEFLAPLVGIMDDPDVENRMVIVGILKGIANESDQAASGLVSITSDSDIRVKNAAISALSQISKPSTEVMAALTKTVREKDHRVRIASIGSLRRLGISDPDSVIPILSDALGQESYDPAKRLIKSALEEIEQKKQGSTAKN